MTEMQFLADVNQLKSLFEIDRISDKYRDFTPFKDKKIGFSIQRKYPDTIHYKPPLTKDAEIDVVALIQVLYEYAESKDCISSKRVPIFLWIGAYSRYLSTHFDYDFNDKNCPTRESVEESKKTPKPISLDSLDEYFLDCETNKFYDSQNNKKTGEEILDTLFDEHCATIHWFKGLSLRWKLGYRNLLSKLCVVIINVLEQLLQLAFGRTLKSEDDFAGTLTLYKRNDMRVLSTESFTIFGCKASKNIVVTFSIMVLLFYSILFFSKSKILPCLKDFFDNELIMISGIVCTIWLLDYFMPILLLWFINLLIKIRIRLIFSRFKFKIR